MSSEECGALSVERRVKNVDCGLWGVQGLVLSVLYFVFCFRYPRWTVSERGYYRFPSGRLIP